MPALKKWLIVLLVGWVVLITGLSSVPERVFSANPDDSVVQDVLDEAGTSANPMIQMGQVEQRLSVKSVFWVHAFARPIKKPYERGLLARSFPTCDCLQCFSRGPPVRFE